MAEDFTVAQFTDLGPNAQPGAYAVPIDFGDGTPLQAGRVTQPGGPGTPFFVDATHTYTQTGTFSVHVRIFKEIGPSAETFSTATVSGAGAPPGPAGRSAGSSGKNLLIVQTAEQEVMVSTTLSVAAVPLPILGSDSVPSGQSDHADDLYWQLLGGEGGSIDPNGWACDALASALEKPTWS